MIIGTVISPCAPRFGVSYSAAATALFARMSVQPTDTRKGLINTLILALQSGGVWAKCDAFYMLAAHDAQAARLNWLTGTYDLTLSGAPTFTTDRGYQSDGTTYLDTGFDPTVAASPKFVLNSHHMGLWSTTNLDNSGANSVDMGNTNNYLRRNTAVSGQAGGRSASGTGLLVGANGFPGYSTIARSTAALWEGYVAGVDAGGGTDASSALTAAAFRVCHGGGGGGGRNQIAAAHFGSNLTAGEVLAAYNAIRAYLQAVGAA